MVTIKDVAREAGVSVSTVSFAINGSAPVAPETRRKILEVIERLGFQPSSVARGLVTRKSNNIGLYIPTPGSDFFSFSGNSLFTNLLQGIGEIAGEKGCNLLLAWDYKEADKPPKVLELARGRAVDGLIFINPNHNEAIIDQLIDLKFSFVFLGQYFEQKAIDTVDIDNFSAAYEVTSHLLRLGHRRIAFISPGPLDYLLCEDRYEGYMEALKDAGLHANPDFFFIGDQHAKSGYEAASRFLSAKEAPTAIVAGRDIEAVGVLEYAADNGLRVPQDLALVSFENSELAEKYNLTSITTDLYVIGKEAAKLLFKTIGRKRERAASSLVIPSELVIRESCGAGMKRG